MNCLCILSLVGPCSFLSSIPSGSLWDSHYAQREALSAGGSSQEDLGWQDTVVFSQGSCLLASGGDELLWGQNQFLCYLCDLELPPIWVGHI